MPAIVLLKQLLILWELLDESLLLVRTAHGHLKLKSDNKMITSPIARTGLSGLPRRLVVNQLMAWQKMASYPYTTAGQPAQKPLSRLE